MYGGRVLLTYAVMSAPLCQCGLDWVSIEFTFVTRIHSLESGTIPVYHEYRSIYVLARSTTSLVAKSTHGVTRPLPEKCVIPSRWGLGILPWSLLESTLASIGKG
jgi:hypothetical protein